MRPAPAPIARVKGASMDELSGVLSRERLLLELLVFKLIELHQLLLAGEARFLGWAAEEVERATDAVRDAELHRSLVVSRLAAQRGVPEEQLSLKELAEHSPDPWRTIFGEHRDAFLALTTEFEDVLAATRRVARSGHAAVTDALERLTGLDSVPTQAPATYGADARWDVAAPGPRVQRTM